MGNFENDISKLVQPISVAQEAITDITRTEAVQPAVMIKVRHSFTPSVFLNQVEMKQAAMKTETFVVEPKMQKFCCGYYM